MSKKMLTFNDDDVQALDPLEAIRIRYDMYITSADPVHHLVKEILDNSVDEFLNGFCTRIDVDIDTITNTIRVKDNGRGLPLGMNSKLNKPTMEVLFTHVHSGAKYTKNTVKVSGGKNGVGIKTLTACGEYLHVTSERDDMIGTMEFSRCKVVQELELKKKKTIESGTTIVFRPDSTLFKEEDIKLQPEKIRDIIELKCFLNAGLLVNITVDGVTETLQYNLGLSDFLNRKTKSPLFNMENIIINGKDEDDNEYEVALTFENNIDEKILSFVNSLPTLRGTHETGFKTGITTVFNDYIKKNNLLSKKDSKLQIKGEDIRRGLVCIISIKHCEPMFDSQSKSELTNKDIASSMRSIVVDKLGKYFEDNPKLAKSLCERAISFARATNNAKETMKKIVKVSSSSMGLNITEKFKDCTSENPDEVELFVIEGDSASGNVEQGRFSKFQCVYPLKGKIKNTYNSKQSSIINVNELNEFLKIMFGTNDLKKIRELFSNGDIEKVIKSKKVIILADSDPDGKHIQNLFINFIYEHLPELVDLGYLYIGVSPFYRVNVSGKWRYFMNDYEYNQFVSEVISKKYKILNSKFNVNKVISKSEEFLREFNRIKHEFSVDSDIINIIIRYNDINEIKEHLNELEIYSDNDDNYEGLYNNIWHSFNLNDILYEVTDLSEIYPFNELEILDKNNKEEFAIDIYDGILELKEAFKYSRNRIKGLGELDPLELRETALDPERRTLIQVKTDREETEKELFKVLFGPSTELRKNFIGENLL